MELTGKLFILFRWNGSTILYNVMSLGINRNGKDDGFTFRLANLYLFVSPPPPSATNFG